MSTELTLVSKSKKGSGERTFNWRAFDEFVAEADKLVGFHRTLEWYSLEALQQAGWVDTAARRCAGWLEQFDPAEHYDDEGELRIDWLSKRLGLMAGTFTENPPSPQVYARMVTELVAAIPDVSVLAVEAACREVVLADEKKPPTAGVVVAAVTKQVEAWERRRYAIADVERCRKTQLENKLVAETNWKRERAKVQVVAARERARHAAAHVERLAVEYAKIVAEAKALAEAADKAEAEFAAKYPPPVIAVLNGVGGLSCQAEIAPAAAA